MLDKLTRWEATKSILACFVGIQSRKNLEREQSDSNMGKFIVLGFTIAITLHIFLYLIVKVIVWQSGVQ